MQEKPEYVVKNTRDALYEKLGDDLFKLTLSSENKLEIFAYGLSKLDESQDEATCILRDLSRWDPQTRSLFIQRSTSLILEKTPFRLVFPNAHMFSFDETGLYVRQYMAVSYCWRSKDFGTENPEDKPYGEWPVSQRFVDAVISEKDHPRVGIWMDQLCIDQTSWIDKQNSVAAMDIIYRSCIRLLVLLEDVYLNEEETTLAKKFTFMNVKFDKGWNPPPDEMAVYTSLHRKVINARWFNRAWCFHEWTVNEPWSDKRQSYEIHNATFIMNGPERSIVKIKWRVLQQLMTFPLFENPRGQEIFANIEFGDRTTGFRSSVMARHNALVEKGCLYLQDKLSIMINMAGLGLAYHGHPLQTSDELLYLDVLLALAAGEAYPLSMFNGSQALRLGAYPTWLHPSLVATDTSIAGFRRDHLHGIQDISGRYIEMDMVMLPPSSVWSGIEDARLIHTFDIFPETIPSTTPSTHKMAPEIMTTARLSDADKDKPIRRFLASCIDNGLIFTARLWAQLQRDVVGPNYNQGFFKDLAPNPLLTSATQRFLAQLVPVSTLGIALPSDFMFKDAHLFLTWVTDPRSMYYISFHTHRISCTLEDEKAFTTNTMFNTHFTVGPAEELRAAVPVDLVDADCMTHKIWHLRPGTSQNGRETWRLVGKALLLGEPDLRREAEESEGRNDAVVKIQRMIVGG